ncbi:MAG: prolyl oligopeptidase family serine peptidase [Pirellulaceae bacterium]|nr:prolyl oligopeptidase family serine peptidase [Pirellulaceae bacterium]
MRLSICVLTFIACLAHATWLPADGPFPYQRTKDIVYGEIHGTGLLMDVFVPTGTPNGRAIVDIASGAWFSDRGKINDHERAQVFNVLCSRGYSVFAIRPGSKTKYTLKEMDQHVKLGIRRVKQLAEEYGFDAGKLGLTGASAGGHLATLAAYTPESAKAESRDELERKYDTSVAAVAVFFPPTDFVEWRPGDVINRGVLGVAIGSSGNGLVDRMPKMSVEDLTAMAKEISPLHRYSTSKVPLLTIHGDADPVVHISHSEKLVKKISDSGGSAELIVVPGGAHPWPTIHEEVKVIADWFDKQLQ